MDKHGTCAVCGKEFVKKQKRSKHCSNRCSNKDPLSEWRNRTYRCIKCNKSITKNRYYGHQKMCVPCRLVNKKCLWCGKDIIAASTRRQYCHGGACAQRAIRSRKKLRPDKHCVECGRPITYYHQKHSSSKCLSCRCSTAICACCEREFTQRYLSQKYCTVSCRNRSNNIQTSINGKSGKCRVCGIDITRSTVKYRDSKCGRCCGMESGEVFAAKIIKHYNRQLFDWARLDDKCILCGSGGVYTKDRKFRFVCSICSGVMQQEQPLSRLAIAHRKICSIDLQIDVCIDYASRLSKPTRMYTAEHIQWVVAMIKAGVVIKKYLYPISYLDIAPRQTPEYKSLWLPGLLNTQDSQGLSEAEFSIIQ